MAAGGGTPKVGLNKAVMKARGGFGSRSRSGAAAPKHSTGDMGYGGSKCPAPMMKEGMPEGTMMMGGGMMMKKADMSSGSKSTTRGVIRKVAGRMGSGSVSLEGLKGWNQ